MYLVKWKSYPVQPIHKREAGRAMGFWNLKGTLYIEIRLTPPCISFFGQYLNA